MRKLMKRAKKRNHLLICPFPQLLSFTGRNFGPFLFFDILFTEYSHYLSFNSVRSNATVQIIFTNLHNFLIVLLERSVLSR